jgi:hypothetical protein
MFKYGFELEGFVGGEDNNVVIDLDTSLPRDGFPGLVEFRTTGGDDLIKQLLDIERQIIETDMKKKNKGHWFDFDRFKYKYSGEELSLLRKNLVFSKRVLDVRNIYGKNPRRNGNYTLASFQINISNQLTPEIFNREIRDGKIVTTRDKATYGLLDIPTIIRNLDKTFKDDIHDSGRQPGMYSIKDTYRLEYRSLPNNVYTTYSVDALARKIREAVEV